MIHATPTLFLDGNCLSCESLAEAIKQKANVELTNKAWNRVSAGREVVERITSAGIPAYGINTGVGSQKDYAVPTASLLEFNRQLVRAHATRVPGPSLSDNVVRGALIVLLNGFAKGSSGVSTELIRFIINRLADDQFPQIDAGGTVGASDLVPLAQIADWLLSSAEAQTLGLPKAKEALSLINSNAVSLTVGALQLVELKQLVWTQDLVAAASMEGFRCNLDAISETVNKVHVRPGQTRVAARLRTFLQGSRLWDAGEARLLQDPLSFRCVSQIHGAVNEVVLSAETVLTQELNSLADNPIVDHESLSAHPNGNMDTTRHTLALDQLRQGVGKIADLCGERIQKLQWSAFSGLPTGLASEDSPTGGVQFLNLGHIAASLITSIKIWAQPQLLISVGQLADGVEDTAGNAFHAVHDLQRQIEASWTVAAIELSIATWSIHSRKLSNAELGIAVREVVDAILPLLPIGEEGRNVFDLSTVRTALQGFVLDQSARELSRRIA